MKIYFSIEDAQQHKFTNPVYEKYICLDFKRLWFTSKSRAICNELRTGTLIDINSGADYISEYYTVVFESRTFLRIKLHDLKNSYWRLRGFNDSRIPKDKFDLLKGEK